MTLASGIADRSAVLELGQAESSAIQPPSAAQAASQEVSSVLKGPMPRLVVASATALFLELACIRWGGSHVLYLSYVSNLLLLTAFMGLGLGVVLAASLLPRQIERWLSTGPFWLLAFVSVIVFFDFEVQIDGPEVVYFRNASSAHSLSPWTTLCLLGLLVSGLFSTLGMAVGRELKAAAPLKAYSIDIGGSLLGIALFSAASWLGVPAYLWFLAALIGFMLIAPARRSSQLLGVCAGAIAIVCVAAADQDSTWSPYQRVGVSLIGQAEARAPGDPIEGTPIYRLRVNNVVHQYISDVRRREPFYEFPYRAAGAALPAGPAKYLTAKPPIGDWSADVFAPRKGWAGRVAIIGAGNGTDTAAALAYNAGHIDAVEIDPLLADIGRRLQPNHVFADPRVTLHIMDGRTFLERAKGPYDLVIFGLPDSLTLASPYAGVRLESFLFTEEAFRSALRVLHPEHGLLVAYNYYRQRWLVDRIATTLARASKSPPLVLLGPDKNLSAAFIAGPGTPQVDRRLGHDWGFRIVEPSDAAGSAIDDWPFLYLKQRSIPPHIGAAIAALIALGFAVALITGWSRAPAHEGAAAAARPARILDLAPFFFMGTAFLLLETSGLVRMSLLFGATWFVNALVFGSVLAMVLIANLLAHLLPMRRKAPLFIMLFASVAVAWAVPPDAFSAWPGAAKYAACTLVLFVPVLLANLAFSQAFRTTAWPARAFGANLLGAVVGGSLENAALVTGYRALFLIAGGLYVLSWLTFPALRTELRTEQCADDARDVVA